MGVNYKIKLKRFNGTDYDTLNLLSENIIMNTGDSLQNDIVPNTNGMLKNNDGVFEVATLGTDFTKINDSSDSSSTETWSINKIKVSASGILYFENINVSVATGDIVTINNEAITSNHILIKCDFDNPANITRPITWETSNGSLVLNGMCVGTTTANIILAKKTN